MPELFREENRSLPGQANEESRLLLYGMQALPLVKQGADRKEKGGERMEQNGWNDDGQASAVLTVGMVVTFLLALLTWIVINYLIATVASWVICWSFGLPWTGKTTVGAFVIYMIFTGGLKWHRRKQDS